MTAVMVLILVGYATVSGRTPFAETGDQYPGEFTSTATPVLFFLGLLAAAISLGGLAFVVIAARPDHDGAIGFEVFRAHRLVERFSLAWVVLACVMVALTAANRSGIAVSRMFSGSAPLQLIDATEQSKAWIVSAVCALAVAVLARWSLQWTSHVVMLLPGAIGVIALGVAGSAGQGPGHDYTTGAAIVVFVSAGLVAGMSVAAAITLAHDTSDDDLRQTASRVHHVAAGLLGCAVAYSVVEVAFLVPARFLVTTAYGRFAVVALAVTAIALVVELRAIRAVRAGTHTRASVITASTIVGVCSIVFAAVVAGMETRTAPGLLVHDFTVLDVFLGYNLPERPTPWTLATMWRLDLVLGLGAVAAAGVYGLGVRNVRRQGIEWSKWRTISWMIGCLSLLVVTSSGLRTYGMALFSIHMIEHMALNMFIPVLLVLGAPVTLALRALPAARRGALPGPREWIVWLVHSRLTAFLSHPVTALIVFVASLYIVYFTPLFGILARYHWGHEAMSIHFLVTGYVFYWAIIGIDPGPRRLPFLARLGLLFAVMPFHAFFGIATMTMNSVIGYDFYGFLKLPWLADLQHDQFLGGAIAWGASEVPVVIVVIALVSQWASSDRRAGARADRQADAYPDDELAAYNAMLEELSRTRR
nr:cytochrome c oxidase assembly protein [Williamsia maris]